MAKSQKRVITALALVMLALLSVCAFSACGSKDYTVTFMIEDKSEVVSVVDGKVTLPEDPTKDGYIFRGWYTDESFSTAFDANAEITEDMTVYAYFVPISANVHVNGENKGEVHMKDYDTFTKTYQDDALSQSLTFDGWYIDAGYTTKYTTQDVDDLYGRYMAEVVFDNGYEIVYTTLVQTGTVMAQPEIASIQKNYMDAEDLSYVDADGNTFDFNKEISVNTTVTVLWKTPYLIYEKIEGSANYKVIGLARDAMDTWMQYPCISILSKNVTVGEDESGNKIVANVVSFDGQASSTESHSFGYINAAKQIMFADGIEYITNLQGTMNNVCEKIILPETLKVLEKSIWNYDMLTYCNVPESLEVIIDCFWKHYLEGIVDTYRGSNTYDFEIAIPAGIKTLAMVPATVKFADGAPYVVEDGMMYKKDGDDKILISVYQSNVKDGNLTVPEGVTKIHVGVLNKVDCSYIYLPSTLTGVEYTVDASEYDTVYDGSYLTKQQYLTAPMGVGMYNDAFALTDKLDKLTYVVFNTTAYPFGDNNYLFLASILNKGVFTYDQLEETKLVFTGEVKEGDISVNVSYKNVMDGTDAKKTTLTFPTGTVLEREAFLSQLGITSEALGVNIKVTSIEQFGVEYAFGAKNCNQYIEIIYEYDVKGFTTTENADGTLTVTGFDQNTAQLLDNGTYLIVIPNELDGKVITAIAEGAFKGNNAISKVYIGNSVKTIGAEAFMNTSNLEYLSVAPGGLEVIGRSAFENMGCINENGKWVMNPEMPDFKFVNYTKKTAYIYIPLANLKTVEPYAFKSMAIASFMPVEGETDRILMKFAYGQDPMYPNPVENEFYYVIDASGDVTGIIQYVGRDTVEQYSCIDATQKVNVTVWDVRLVATISGTKASDSITIGWEVRPFAAYFGEAFDTNVLRYEVMEGSVYYRSNVAFGIVSKVHKNAFTDMGTTNSSGEEVEGKVSVYNRTGDNGWIQKDDVINQNSEIFEDGWWEGIPNSEITVTNEDKVGDFTSLLIS